METLVLILHVISGTLALLSGSIVMVLRKGNNRHIQLGNIYFWSMITVVVSALYLSIVKESTFLLYVGIFVFYQVYAGKRSIKNKQLKPNILDVVVLSTAVITAYFMVTSGSVVLIVFGVITFFLAFGDIRVYAAVLKNRKLKTTAWLARHIGMMIGAYIGTFTAFLVVNLNFVQPLWLVWLGPTIVFVPLMQYWTWKYTRAKNKRAV